MQTRHTTGRNATTSRRGRAAKRHAQATTLAIALANNLPPTEFRIFTAGTVDTVKGAFTFDEAAAKAVLAEYQAHGIDLMIDYDHASLGSNADPALASRAAGWFNIEVRDGELWAVNVRWTPDAEAALIATEWRFMSPAFQTDGEGRIVSLMNVAITNLPATRKLEPLMAASARDLRRLSSGTSFDAIRMAINAALQERFPVDPATCIGGVWVADVYDTTAVYELDGKLFEVAYTFADGVASLGGAATEVERSYKPVASATAAPAPTAAKKLTAMLAAGGIGMDPKLIKEALDALIADDAAKCQEILKGLVASAAGAEVSTEDAPVEPLAAAGDKPEEIAAALSAVTSLSGKTSLVGSVADIRTWHASHVALAAERKALAEREAILESAERRKLCVELVTLGGRAPATVWASPDAGAPPQPYLAEMPIASLRAMRDAEVKANAGRAPIKPPTGGGGGDAPAGGEKEFATEHGTVTLSARELANCAETKADPQVYASNKAAMIKARGGR